MRTVDLERRGFIKLGLAAGAGLAASGALGALAQVSGRHVSRTTSNFHRPIDTACRICPAGCGIRAFVDGAGNLVTLSGISGHPINDGKICARGMAAINLHYHPERLLDPVAAVNGRGVGFTAIRNEAALSQAGRMIRDAKNAGALFVIDTEDDEPSTWRQWLDQLGVEGLVLSRPVYERARRCKVDFEAFGQPYVHANLDGARTILVFGANPFEGGPYYIAQARGIVDARVKNGAKLFVFDSRNTNTAGRADRWLPIRPGTEYAAALYLLKRLADPRNELSDAIFAGLNDETVFEYTGVKPERMHEVVEALRSSGRTSIIVGDGVFSQDQAIAIRRALALLERSSGGYPVFAQGPQDASSILDISPDRLYGRIADSSRPVFLITRRSNPVYDGGGPALAMLLRGPDKVTGHLSICSFVNETNQYADLIVPEALPLEEWGLVPAIYRSESPTWTLQRPVAKAPAAVMNGLDFINTAAGTSILANERRVRDRIAEMDWSIPTEGEANCFENHTAYPVSQDASMPGWEDLTPFSEFESPHQDGRFALVVHDSNVMNASLANAKWLAEIAHRNALAIHVDDATKLGIKQGDAVRVVHGDRRIVASAFVCQSVRPGVVALARGYGHENYGKIAAGKRWRTDDPDAWLIWWGEYGNGVNAGALTREKTIAVKVTKA
jgi:anaerobic selenocysteine-containing dehydrogenase